MLITILYEYFITEPKYLSSICVLGIFYLDIKHKETWTFVK